LSAVVTIMQDASSPGHREILRRQADMIYRTAQRSVSEAGDLADIKDRYETAVRWSEAPVPDGRGPVSSSSRAVEDHPNAARGDSNGSPSASDRPADVNEHPL
jgi:hypothetical protein